MRVLEHRLLSRDKKAEYRSGLSLGLAAEANAAMPLFEQVFCDPEAKPCSNLSLGSEEWSKEFLLVFRRNTSSIVGYSDSNSLVARLKMPRRPGTNQNPAALVAGIDGIRYQIRQNLLELSLRRASHQPPLDSLFDTQCFLFKAAVVDGQNIQHGAGNAELYRLRIIAIEA